MKTILYILAGIWLYLATIATYMLNENNKTTRDIERNMHTLDSINTTLNNINNTNEAYREYMLIEEIHESLKTEFYMYNRESYSEQFLDGYANALEDLQIIIENK